MMALLARLGVTLRRILDDPFRVLRGTAGQLTVGVALALFLFVAAARGPRSVAFHERAEKEAGTVAQLLEERDRLLTLAQACRTDLEELRRGTVIDASTERYLSSRMERLTAEAKYRADTAAYHAELKRKYRRATWLFWEPVSRPPRPPRDPLATASRDSRLVKTHEIRGRRGKTVAFSPDGKTLAIGCTDHRVELVDTRSGKPRMSLDWPEGLFYSVAFSPDGSKLAGAVSGEATSLWDLSDGRLVWTRPSPAGSTGQAGPWITTTAFSPDGQGLAVADNGVDESSPPVRRGTVQLLDVRTGSPKWEYATRGSWVESIAFAPDGETMVCAAGELIWLDARTGKPERQLEPSMTRAVSVAFSPDGRTLAAGGSVVVSPVGDPSRSLIDGRITLRDSTTFTMLRTLNGLTRCAEKISFSPDGKWIAGVGTGPSRQGRLRPQGEPVTSRVSEVRLWDAATGDLSWTVEGEFGTEYSMALAFSPDGETLVFCDNEHVEARDVRSGKLRRVYMETEYRIFIDGRPLDVAEAVPTSR
jgi:WD40 repeat protein